MSIRFQLLIVALTTLVLPWAGWQYARELEAALRGSQEKSLLASAGTIANALSAQPQRVFRNTDDTQAFNANAGDLYVFPLHTQPALDGYRDDWGVLSNPTPLPTPTGYRARAQAASTERYLYLYVEVDDAHFDAEPNNPRLESDKFDRVELTLSAPAPDTGEPAMAMATKYFFGTNAPGLIAAQTSVKDDLGEEQIAAETRIQAFWLQTSHGYHLEARIPLSFVGTHLWIKVLDGSSGGVAGIDAPSAPAGGRLFFSTDGLTTLLSTFVRDGTRATVIDDNALKLGAAGNLTAAGALDSKVAESTWHRYFMGIDTSNMPVMASTPDRLGGDAVQAALEGQPFAQWVVTAGDMQVLLTAAAPITVDGHYRGAVVLEQAADQTLALRDHALTRLFDLTLLATASAVAIMLIFATWIAVRLGRLRTAAESAVSNDGHIRLHMPESGASDEIGALARGFEKLLIRLNEHTQYLRTLGGKLSHELRTPLTIVRSSLDNLESEGLRDDQQRYIERAREGTQRLSSILSALGAAARVEESIKQTDRTNFDLRALLMSTIEAYRVGFPGTAFALEQPSDPCFASGAPDLIVQLLDKLIENAVDFTPAAGVVTVRLARMQIEYELSVSNDGPVIPDSQLGHLFESLFEQRQAQDDRPHFGLGLYIVRLIAEFHGGTARAANRPSSAGAVFTVTIPMI